MNNSYQDIVNTLPHAMRRNEITEEIPSLQQAVKHINNMDFSAIYKKLCSGDPLLCRRWSPTEAEIAIQYYRNFLFINKKYLDTYPVLPPLLEVDEVWHHHILDTRQYAHDCQNIFGYYFHHFPYFGSRSAEDLKNLNIAFEKVQELHQQEFGQKMVSIWEG